LEEHLRHAFHGSLPVLCPDEGNLGIDWLVFNRNSIYYPYQFLLFLRHDGNVRFLIAQGVPEKNLIAKKRAGDGFSDFLNGLIDFIKLKEFIGVLLRTSSKNQLHPPD